MSTSIDDIKFKDYITRPTTSAIDYGSWVAKIGDLLNLYNDSVSHGVTSPPEQQKANLPFLRRTANATDTLNELQSQQFDKTYNPQGYAARQAYGQRVLQDADEGPSKDLSNLWTKIGLENSIATGANTGSGFARSALADSTRRDYIADRDRRTAALGALADANPMKRTGLDTGAALARVQQTWDTNRTNRDTYAQNNRANEQQGVANLMGVVQGLMQTSAAQKSADLQAQRDYENERLNWDLYMAQLQAATQGAPAMSWWQRAIKGAQTGAQEGSIGGPWGALGGAVGGAVDGSLNGPIYQMHFKNDGSANSDYSWLNDVGNMAGSAYNSYFYSGSGRNPMGEYQYFTNSVPRATAVSSYR